MTTEGVKQKGTAPVLQRWHFPGQVGCPGCAPLSVLNGETWPASADRSVVRVAVGESFRQTAATARPPLPYSPWEQFGTVEHALSSAWQGKLHLCHANDTVPGTLAMKYASKQASVIRRLPLNRMDFSRCANFTDYPACNAYRPIRQPNSSGFAAGHGAATPPGGIATASYLASWGHFALAK